MNIKEILLLQKQDERIGMNALIGKDVQWQVYGYCYQGDFFRGTVLALELYEGKNSFTLLVAPLRSCKSVWSDGAGPSRRVAPAVMEWHDIPTGREKTFHTVSSNHCHFLDEDGPSPVNNPPPDASNPS